MVTMHIHTPKNKPDDFYLQWDYIYWWQMKHNLTLMIKKSMERINL